MLIKIPIAVVWPFASGWMLFWALAAAIPIIIHLWHRRQYQQINWAAMEYLLAAMRKNSRRITIEQLILLGIRVLILLLLAVALADPFLPSLKNIVPGFGAGGQTHWVVVIDGSYSMDFKKGQQTRFEVAKDLASQLVDQSTQGDGFTLVLMSDPPRVIIREPAFARNDIIEEIDSLDLPQGGGNLSSTLSEVEKIVRSAIEKRSRLARTKICIFSDMGRTTWDDIETPGCRTRIGSLAEVATLSLIDLGKNDEQRNLAVTRLDMNESLVTVGRSVTFQVEIENLGAQQVAPHRVEFIVDGQRIDEHSIEIAAHGRAIASASYEFTAPGEHYVEVQLDEDLLSVDNHRWLSVPVLQSIPVLCVQGKPESAKHVAIALEPGTLERPRVVTKVASENAILEMDLSQFDCIFLCNVGRFSREEAGVLYEFLNDGGGLVFFLGDQVQLESYNEQLGGEESGRRILPARLESITSEAQYRFDPLEYRHEIVAPFRGHQQAGLLTTPVWKYFKLSPYDNTAAKVALAFEGGDPAIIEEKILRGRSIIYASAASIASVDQLTDPPTPWTAIQAWPSFPPLVQEMLALSIRGRTTGRNTMVGDGLEGVTHNTIVDVPLTMVKPDGSDERVKMSIDGEDSRWNYNDAWRSGIYQARYGPPRDDSQIFAVNVNTRESNLERFDSELLPSQFDTGYEVEDLESPQLPSSTGSQLFQYALMLLLLLLFSESILAWFFGRARI